MYVAAQPEEKGIAASVTGGHARHEEVSDIMEVEYGVP